jgi:hypothetical protein
VHDIGEAFPGSRFASGFDRSDLPGSRGAWAFGLSLCFLLISHQFCCIATRLLAESLLAGSLLAKLLLAVSLFTIVEGLPQSTPAQARSQDTRYSIHKILRLCCLPLHTDLPSGHPQKRHVQPPQLALISLFQLPTTQPPAGSNTRVRGLPGCRSAWLPVCGSQRAPNENHNSYSMLQTKALP